MKIFLIDGNSYIYRAFYAIRELSNSKGEPTNAVFGFTNMLLKILREQKPDCMIIALDSPEPTKRHKAYSEYKAQRPETPDLLTRQIPNIRKIIDAMQILTVEKPGYEADDILAAAAKKLSKDESNEIYIITADKDMLQIVDERIKIYDPMKDLVIDDNYVKEKYGLPPERIPEMMALTGDTIDNIPGVKGIGGKTAKDILRNADSLSELLENPELAGKEKLAKLIRENSDLIRLSYELATLISDAPVDVDTDMCTLKEPRWRELLALFRDLEFSSLMKFIPDFQTTTIEYEIVNDLDRLELIIAGIQETLALKIETSEKNPMFGIIAGISISTTQNKGYYIPFYHAGITEIRLLRPEEIIHRIRPVLENERISKISHCIKNDIVSLGTLGISLRGTIFDTMIASHLLNPNRSSHSLEDTVLDHLEVRKKGLKDILGKKNNLSEVHLASAAQFAAEDSAYPMRLKEILFEKLARENLSDVYSKIEVRLIPVLAGMEMVGVKVDRNKLKALSKELERELDVIEKKIYELAGREFNINSPKQLSEVLFQELGLNPVKKTKSGYSTDISVLEALSAVHDLPLEILNFRSLSKLKNTYIDALPGQIHPSTGRLHTSFNQTVTATGRLSSSEPNLQNIPARGEWARRIREAFIAEEGNMLVSADYSQIELRILAHMSEDPKLIEAFRQGTDIHTITASEIFSVGPHAVTRDMRRIAKSVNFGIIYGITPFGLSETLKCSPEEARLYIDKYFSIHSGVKEFIDETIRGVRETGYSLTLFGRKRPVPEIGSKNSILRSQAERIAVNSPIQGTAADIIKIAMINAQNNFTYESISARIILQVHDELVVECEEGHVEQTYSVLKNSMESAANLTVPIKVDIFTGHNWAETHK